MKTMQQAVWTIVLIGLFAVGILIGPGSPGPAEAADPLYWCPDKTSDQQYSFNPAPGCVPFTTKEEEKKKAERRERENKEGLTISLENFQSQASKFLNRYRQFLDCCAADLGSLNEVQDLEDQASDLLTAFQETDLLTRGSAISPTTQRQFTISEIIRPIAKARQDLRYLRTRLEQIKVSQDQLDSQDYETAARERRRIQDEEEAIRQNFKPTRPPEAPRTGMEVQDTTLPNRIGTSTGDTTLPNSFGPDIGNVVSPNADPQTSLRPRVGSDAQDSSLQSRPGPTTQDTTLPYRFGFESQDTTNPQRVGPGIGDSSLNKQR